MGFLQRRLVKGGLWVVSLPKVTLAICALLLMGAVLYAKMGLTLSTDQDALLTPKLKFFRDYLRFDEKFPENEAFVVIIEPNDFAHPPEARRWIAFADAMAAE